VVTSRLQSNRYEYKYLVPAERALEIREFVQPYLVPDHNDHPMGYGYEVNSLYLDSPGLELCNATVEGQKNRFKLRLRWYSAGENEPVFFEIKRRVDDQILKERAIVRRDAVQRLLSGHWAVPSDLKDPRDGQSLSTLQHFCKLRNALQATGTVYVKYLREAWVPEIGNDVRVTFDRGLRGTGYGENFSTPVLDWDTPYIDGTILELKFNDRFPRWLSGMSQAFNLHRISVPKYVECASSIANVRPLVRRPDGEIFA
jgi:hypothetical protein